MPLAYDIDTLLDFKLAKVERKASKGAVDIRDCRTIAQVLSVFGYGRESEVVASGARVEYGVLIMDVSMWPEQGRRGEYAVVRGIRKYEYGVGELSVLNAQMMEAYDRRIERLEASFDKYVELSDWMRGCTIGHGLLECRADLVPLGLHGKLEQVVCEERFASCKVGGDRYMTVKLRLSAALLTWEWAADYWSLIERYVRAKIVILDMSEGEMRRLCRREFRGRALFEMCGHVVLPESWGEDKKWAIGQKWCRRT